MTISEALISLPAPESSGGLLNNKAGSIADPGGILTYTGQTYTAHPSDFMFGTQTVAPNCITIVSRTLTPEAAATEVAVSTSTQGLGSFTMTTIGHG